VFTEGDVIGNVMSGECVVYYTHARTKKIITTGVEKFNGLRLKVNDFPTLKRAVRESLDEVISDYPYKVN
jgi:hypothetical protein